MRNGAAAFLTKDCAPNDVLETIRAVHRGDQSVDAVRVLVERAGTAARRPHPEETLAPLSPREREIFLLAAKGLRNGEIAASAYVSETTVKTHVSNILGKLGLHSGAQIVVLAYESGLVTP